MRLWLFIIWSVSTCDCFAQDVDLDFHRSRIDNFQLFEKKSGGYLVPNTFKAFPGPGVSQPLQYLHKLAFGVEFRSYYSYYFSDSSIQEIDYEWEYKGKPITNTKDSVIVSLVSTYDSLVSQIVRRYPDSEQPEFVTRLARMNLEGINVSNFIEANNGLVLSLQLGLSSGTTTGGVAVPAYYRIGLQVLRSSGSVGEKSGELSLDRIRILDSISFEFMNSVVKRKWNETRDMCVYGLYEQLTEKFLGDLLVELGDPAKLFFRSAGRQVIEGKMADILLFVDKSKSSTDPPTKKVTLAFTNHNKIVKLMAIHKER